MPLCRIGGSRGLESDCKIVTRIQFFFQIPLGTLGLMYGLSFLLQDTPHSYGNKSTCQLQDFLMQFGLGGSYGMDLSLSLVYLLIVKCDWTEKELRMLEKWLHCVIHPAAVLPAVDLGARLEYDAIHLYWIPICQGDAWCELEYRTGVFFRSCVHLVSVVHIIFSVYVLSRVLAYATSSNQQRSSRMIARKGLLYTTSIVMVQLPLLVDTLIGVLFGFHSRDVSAIAGSATPLAGLVNVLVFMMNRREMRSTHGWACPWDQTCLRQQLLKRLPTNDQGAARTTVFD